LCCRCNGDQTLAKPPKKRNSKNYGEVSESVQENEREAIGAAGLRKQERGYEAENDVPRSAINKDIRKENIEKPRRFG